MITAKQIFYSAALVLAGSVLAVIAAYVLVDDESLVAWIAGRAESTAGVSISYSEPAKLTRTLSPTLTVADLSVTDPESGYGFRTSSLELQISLLRLLLGRLDIPRLWLGDTRVELDAGATSRKQAAGPAGDGLRALPPLPALHDVQIAQLHIVSEEEELRVPTLDIDELALGFERDTNTLQLTARIDMADESVAVEVKVPRFHAALDAGVLGFSASARSAVASLMAQGQLDVAKPEFILDGDLSAQASDLKQIPTGIPALKAPGTLAARAQLAGTVDRLAVSNIAVKWQGPEQSSLEIKGGIDDLDDLAGVALDVSAQLGESPWLAAVLPDSVGELKHAELSGHISGAAPQFAVRELSLAAKDVNDLEVSVRGQLDLVVAEGHAEGVNMDLELTFGAPTTRAARALLFEDIPEFGAIEGRANIHSEMGPPSFENIVVSARDPAGIEVDLNGRIAEFPLDAAESNRGYDLDVSMKATRVALMAERLGVELPFAGPLDASYRIEGDTQALRLEQIRLAVGEKKAIQLSAEGQVHFGDWDQADPLQMLNLGLLASSHDTRTLATLLGTELPELGALSASARVKTVSNRHQITDFQLQTAKNARVAVSLNGVVDHVLLLPEPAAEGIALTASVSTADISRLNALFGGQDAIPPIGPARASAKLSGNDQKLSVSDVSVTAGKPDVLLVKASGGLGTLALANDWHPRNADLSIEVSATGSNALAAALGYTVPELGPVAGSAKLRDKDRTLGLESGRLRVGDAKTPVVQAEGFVSDLLGAVKTRWDVALDLDGHRLAEFADKQKLPDLAALRGSLQISNADGTLGIDALSLKSTGSEILSVDVEGQYGDFGKPESLSLTGSLKARDMQTAGALLDLDWPAVGPLSIDTRISRTNTHTAIDASMTADKFELDANLTGVLAADPPKLSGTVTARNAFIPRMAAEAAEEIKEKRTSQGPFFSREPIAFDWLSKVDLDLSVDVESFDPELARGKSAQAQITLKSGQLSVSPVTIDYPKGQLELDVKVEARDRPSIRFKAFGESLDPWRSLYIQELKKELDADLDVDIDLSLSGNSPHALAASAEGDIFLELKDGIMRRDLVDLVFADIIGWAWGKTSQSQYYEFGCGVVDYRIDQGVVTTRAFLLDASHIAISGEGTIDLGREQVDYVFLPKKKSRVIRKADPVKVTGALNDPSVKVIPWKSAAATYGPLLFGPFIFAGVTAADYLGSKLRGNAKESPCLAYERERAERSGEPAAQ